MAWNGSGSFTRTYGSTGWQTQAAAGVLIVANNHDTNDQDLATGINACLTKNNESKPTATFRPAVDTSLDLGSTALRWQSAYVSTSVVWQGATYATSISATPTANRTITLPDTSGQVVASSLSTPYTTTGGTSADITSIPLSARRIVVSLVATSTNGTDPWLFQLGTSGTPQAVNYRCTAAAILNGVSPATTNSTTGFQLFLTAAAAAVHGEIAFTLADASQNYWTCAGTFARSDTAAQYTVYGSVQLGGALDIIRLTTTGGTDTFDAMRMSALFM